MAKLSEPPPRERSQIATLGTAESGERPFIVYADCQLTRRKRHHMICDGFDNVLFRSRWWSDILDWLARENETDYTVVTDRDRYRATSEVRGPEKE